MFAATRTRYQSVATLYKNVLTEAQRFSQTGPLVNFLESNYQGEVAPDTKASTSKQPFGGNTRTQEERRAQTLENLHIFLTNKLIYADLLIRYNPQHGLTEEERVRLTARRVGLEVPINFKYGNAESKDLSASYRASAKMAQDRYGKDKEQREHDLYSGKGDGVNSGGPLRPPKTYE